VRLLPLTFFCNFAANYESYIVTDSPMKFKDKTVLITGGASGIGKIMGAMALSKGAKRLVVWDINEQNLADTSKAHSTLGTVNCYRVDVSDTTCIEKTYKETTDECGAIDILIQCAGIVTSNATFENLGLTDIDRTMKINAIAPMYVALPILQDMIRRDSGHICNIASAAGMISNPRMSVYAASKWSVIGWSDSVRIELAERGSKVRFTTVTPYYINTGMFQGVSSKIFPILDPEKTAAKIIRAIEKDNDFRGIPWGPHFIRFWQGILPTRLFDLLFGQLFGIYHTMDHFTGRKNP